MARLRVGRRALAAGLGASALLGITAGSAGAATVRIGTRPQAPAQSRTVGALPGTASMHLTVALQPRDPAALESYATHVSTPGSTLFRQYLSVAQFRQRFAPTDAQIASVRSALQEEGLTPAGVSANGLTIRVGGSAAQVSRAFSVSLNRVQLASGRVAYDSTAAPAVPSKVASLVQGVYGLDSLERPLSNAMHGSSALSAGALDRSNVVTGGPQPCSAASGAGVTADQLASSYGFSALYEAGDEGAGQTIALIEFEPDSPSDISAYASCYGLSTSGISYVPVDGGVGSGSGQGESTLDIEDALGLAPQASILVYQDPWNNDADYLNEYSTIVSQDKASVISTSWYYSCDDGVDNAQVQSDVNTMLEEAATQGQSFYAAQGDAGAAACLQNHGSGAPAVQDPGSDPFATSVGGTAITAFGPRPTETTYNDPSGGAGGGGISKVWRMPTYQSAAPASLNVVNANSSGKPCGATSGDCREVPDVSADSSDVSAYAIYYQGNWYGFWGTSAAAPLWAAYTALVNASSACDGTTVGFANPLLYQAAANDYSNAFNDITTGTNDWTGSTGGLFPAGAGYDMASGLGTPNGSVLAQDLCDARSSAVTVTSPGKQSGPIGAIVSLPIQATDTTGAQLSYQASGLPPGLSIDASSGVISGTTTTSGNSKVTVTVTDADHATGTTSFIWTVTGQAKARIQLTCQHPSAAQTSKVAGGKSITVSCTALVQHAEAAKGAAKPTGTVSFAVSPSGTSQPASCALPATAGVRNQCTTTLTTSTEGTYTITAAYHGDPTYASISAPATLKVK